MATMPHEQAPTIGGGSAESGFMAPTRSSLLHHLRDEREIRLAKQHVPAFGAAAALAAASWKPVSAVRGGPDAPAAAAQHYHLHSPDTQSAIQWNLPPATARPSHPRATEAPAQQTRANPLVAFRAADREQALARHVNAAVIGQGIHTPHGRHSASASASPGGSPSGSDTEGGGSAAPTSRMASRATSRPVSAATSRPSSAATMGVGASAAAAERQLLQLAQAQQHLAGVAASNGAVFRAAGLPSYPTGGRPLSAGAFSAPSHPQSHSRPATARTAFAPSTGSAEPPLAMVDPRALAPQSRDAVDGLSLRIGSFTPAAPLDPNDPALSLFRNNAWSTDAAYYQGLKRRASGRKPIGGLDADEIDPAFKRTSTAATTAAAAASSRSSVSEFAPSSFSSAASSSSSSSHRPPRDADGQDAFLYSSFAADGIFRGDVGLASAEEMAAAAAARQPTKFALYRAKESVAVPRADGSFVHAWASLDAATGQVVRQPKLFLQKLLRPSSGKKTARTGGGGGDDDLPAPQPKDDMRVTSSARTVAEQARRAELRMLKQYRTVMESEEKKRKRLQRANSKLQQQPQFES